ncbi:MAG: hypothetical protein HY296_00370 [Thaumarchaeota archaeon]|nr:hypothetical protein [Nitrososphaerota archaeon]
MVEVVVVCVTVVVLVGVEILVVVEVAVSVPPWKTVEVRTEVRVFVDV